MCSTVFQQAKYFATFFRQTHGFFNSFSTGPKLFSTFFDRPNGFERWGQVGKGADMREKLREREKRWGQVGQSGKR